MITDVRVVDAEPTFTEALARTPYKFGNALLDGITRADVAVGVEDRSGRTAMGRGTVFLSHMWAFPGTTLSAAEKDAAMRSATTAFCRRLTESKTFGHPIDLFLNAAADFGRIEAATTVGLPLPRLAMLVCASPVDAALHDAFGRVHGVSAYDAYGKNWMARDLADYLRLPELRGRFVGDVIQPPSPRVSVFHTVGGMDALTPGDVKADAPLDGLPNSLDAWIRRDGIRCFKIKLGGRDLAADVARVIAIWDVVTATVPDASAVQLSIDPNEQCDSPAFLVELLEIVRAQRPAAYDAVVLIEQPTERNLLRSRHDMRPLARLKPTLIDESLTGPDDLELARELGWSGVVLKTCKCQTLTLLTAAKARAFGMPMCVADLTNPGPALLQSVGLASRLSVMAGIEANCRQFFPTSLDDIVTQHPEVARVHDGVVSTATLSGPGLGYGD